MCQKLVSYDAVKRKRLVEGLGKKKQVQPTSPSPPKLPKVGAWPCPPKPERGLPPLAGGIGVGEGVGSVVLGLEGIGIGAEVADCIG